MEFNLKTFFAARPYLLGLAILFFFLPMFNIKCNSPIGGPIKIASISGQKLVTGGNVSVAKDLRNKMNDLNFGDDKKSKSQDDEKPMKLKPNIIAILSLVAIIVALVFCFVAHKFANEFTMLSAGLSALLLIVMAFVVKNYILTDKNSSDTDTDVIKFISVSPAIGFFLILLSTVSVAVITYMHHKQQKTDAYHAALEYEAATNPVIENTLENNTNVIDDSQINPS
jgi:cbb3-type cytochrome oxidase subunit 3